MIDFLVVGLPRSGTTWVANWLTTGSVFCAHDPLYHTHYDEWGLGTSFPSRYEYKQIGAACTGIWRWPEWVNAQSCPKVILHRDLDEVNNSLDCIGFPRITEKEYTVFMSLEGFSLQWDGLFDPTTAEAIWEMLLGPGFCEYRHAELVKMNVQPMFSAIKQDPEVYRALAYELVDKGF